MEGKGKEKEREEESSLPPDYVSLAQLQERWLKKQEEKKLREKQEERKNDGHEKMGGGCVGNVLGRKDGGEMGVIEERGKGKEIVVDGFENGEEKKKKNLKKKKRKERRLRKTKCAGDEGKGKAVEKEKVRIEKGVENEVEIVPENGLEGIEEIATVSMVEVLPENGVKGEISDVKRRDFRGGLGKNGHNRGSFYEGKKESDRHNHLKQNEGALAFGEKIGDEREYGKKLRERGRNGEYRERYNRMKESRADVLKGNKGEPEAEKKAVDEILEVFSEKCGLSGADRNGVYGQSNNGRNRMNEDRVEGEGLNDDKVAPENKVDHKDLVVESAKNGEEGREGRGYGRFGNWRENFGEGGMYGNWRGNVGEGRRDTRSRRFEDHRKVKQREGVKMWVKKEEKPGADAAEVGSSGNHQIYHPAL